MTEEQVKKVAVKKTKTEKTEGEKPAVVKKTKAKAASKENVKKERLKNGAQVKLLVGPKDKRGSLFTVKKIDGDKVYLDGYRLFNRTTKVTQENTNTHRTVHHPVHISNVTTKIKSN